MAKLKYRSTPMSQVNINMMYIKFLGFNVYMEEFRVRVEMLSVVTRDPFSIL